ELAGGRTRMQELRGGDAAHARRRRTTMSQHVMFKFRVYIADGVQNSAQAVSNLTALCRAHLPDRHEIEVVDVFRDPKRALADRILMTPTLVKVEPSPIRRVIGTLSQTQPVLQALGLETLAT